MRNRAQFVTFGRLIDGPAAFPKDFGSVEVRVRSIAAGATQKLGLGRSVQLLGMPAVGTFAAGVSRIDRDHRDASGNALVGNKEFKLIERPGMQDGTLRQPSLNSVADALQFFQHHGAICAFSFRNNLLGDNMVHIFGKTCLAARQLLEKAATTVRAFLLQFGAKVTVAMTDAFDLRPAKAVAIRIGENFCNAKIAAQKTIGRRRYGSIFTQHQMDIQFFGVAFQHQRSHCGFLALEKMSLIIAQREFGFDPAIHCGQTDGFRLFNKPKQVFIEVCAAWLKSGWSFLPFAKAGGNAGNGADSIIASKAIFGLDTVVAKFMQRKLLAHVLAVGNCQNVIAGSSELVQRGKQRLPLFFRWFELTSHCLYGVHNSSVPLSDTYFNGKGRY